MSAKPISPSTRSVWIRLAIALLALCLFVITVSIGEYLMHLITKAELPLTQMSQDRDAMAAYMTAQPASLYLGVALVHFVAAIVGGLVIGLGSLSQRSLWIASGVFALAGLTNLFIIPGQPWWFWVLDVLMFPLGAWLGYRWVSSTRKVVAERI